MSHNQRCRAIAALAMTLALSTGRPRAGVAEDWPGLWGPTRNGESPAASASPPRTATELWRRTTAGGYSEIAIANGRAVTMEMRHGDDFVVAFDAASGKEIWSARVGPTYRGHGGSHDGPIATPTLAGDDVFAAGPHGQLVALDMKTGKERWRHDLAASLGAAMPRWGFAASPLVEAGLVAWREENRAAGCWRSIARRAASSGARLTRRARAIRRRSPRRSPALARSSPLQAIASSRSRRRMAGCCGA